MVIGADTLTAMATAWAWPFARVAGLITAAPVFGYRALPARVKVAVAVALTMVIAPGLPPMPAVDPVSAGGLLITAQQVLIGLALGFAMRTAFLVLEVAGQQIAQLMGLGFASMVDPQNGIEVPVVSLFYILLATLIYLGLDGHLVLVEVMARSFHTLPVGPDGVGAAGLWLLVSRVGWVFQAGLSLALPAIAAMLTVNLAFGVMARSAPQLNIFVVGFPVALVFGLTVILFSLPAALARVDGIVAQALGLAQALAGAR